MSGALIITHQDDSPLTGITLTAERGTPSDPIDVKITNIGTDPVEGAFLTLYAEPTPGTGIFSSTGHPAVDERQGRFEVTGQIATVTPGQEIQLDVVQSMGHLKTVILPPILPGDSILGNFWIEQPGSSAAGGAVNVKIEIANQRTAYALPMGIGFGGGGINRGKGQPKSFIVSGRHTAASGTADDVVHVAAGTWVALGTEYSDPTVEDLTLNQNDGAVAALASGESYIAIVTQPAGQNAVPTVTKGAKGATPTPPTPPPNELLLARVTVNYQAGGTSVISAGDITETMTFGRYLVEPPPSGLVVSLQPGESIIDAYAQVQYVPESVTLPASSTSIIWKEWNGATTVTTAGLDAPPSYGAVPLWEVLTNSTDVDTITDRRRYFHAGELQTETPGGVIDGSNAVFTISQDGAGMFFDNGTLLFEGDNYSRQGRTITLFGSPSPGDALRWVYLG